MTPTDSADLEVVEALIDAVMDGAVGEQAGEASAARVEQTLGALDVEIGLLLSGEARRRQVLGGRRTAHRQTDIFAVLVLKLAVRVENLRGQVVREPGAVDDLSGALGLACQHGDVGGVDFVELGVQRVPGAGAFQHVAVGLGGGGEPVRNADALPGQLLVHLAQRGVLAADKRHVGNADLVEESDVSGHTHELSSRGG